MVPILFPSNETQFTSNGLGRLVDARVCEVTEARNGEYELYMEYPINGALFNYLAPGLFIYTTHDCGGVPEAFQIYEISEPISGFVEINAWHISYMLNSIILEPFSANSITAVMAAIPQKSINTNPFTFWTDKSVVGDYELSEPRSVRSVLGGSRGSILDRYGKGEYEFNMFEVKLYTNRGADRGVSIRYGKNLSSIDRQLDAADVFNSVVPFWKSKDQTVYLDHIVTKTGQTPSRTIALDMSDDFEDPPTTAELETAAQSYVDSTTNYQIRENIRIDFVPLWQTEEYKDFANLQKVFLCDTVHIFYNRLGLNLNAKCIKVVYDSLRERYSEIELGEPRTSLAQQIEADVVAPALADVPNQSAIDAAIDRATELISGGYGGYIKYNYLDDGTPSEMLIMDSPDEATATNIIRLNQNGIGFSTNGGSTYRSAWTIDGQFDADFITAGTINANLMTAGVLQDANGFNVWNLDTGELTIRGYATEQYAESYTDNALDGYKADVAAYMQYSGGTLTLGNENSQFKALLDNTRLAFTGADGNVVAWISNNQLFINEAVIETDIQVPGTSGKWLIRERNEHLQFKWVNN